MRTHVEDDDKKSSDEFTRAGHESGCPTLHVT